MSRGADKKLIEDVLALPDEQIEEVVEAIVDRLYPDSETGVEIEPELHNRVAKRIAEIQKGEAETVDWETVREMGRTKLDKQNA